ncbi:MAG: hypothetical protein JW924_03325 [Fusobacteriaceae bacterium]|nr:hypothetical protein [Fusobacteriaceae bacterium]
MKFKITLREKKPNQIASEIQFIEASVDKLRDEVLDIGKKAEIKMKNIIDTNRRRPQSPHDDTNVKASKKSLIDGIQLDMYDTLEVFGWGLGNINELDKNSPHWAMINWGGLPPSTKDYNKLRGKFEPEDGGLFRKGSPYYPIYPTKLITPLNYIEQTANFVRDSLTRLTNIFRR